MAYSGYKKAGTTLALFLKSNWLYVLIGVVLIPFLVRIWKTQLSGLESQQAELTKDRHFREAQDPQKLMQKWDSYLQSADPASISVTHDHLKDAARRLIEGFNINIWDSDQWYTKLNPEGWFQTPELYMPVLLDDELMYNFVHIAELYYYGTRMRDLNNDIVKLLPRSEQQQLKDAGYNYITI